MSADIYCVATSLIAEFYEAASATRGEPGSHGVIS